MKPGTGPIDYLWWLVSRASGIIALVLVSLSVLMGLAMATRVIRRPGLRRAAARLHEHVALVALAAIGTHGLSLLGDTWLKPGWRGIAVPFALAYRPQFTGLGIIAGYLVVLLGPSFYLRRRIGARRWRRLHPLMLAAWIMAAVHTVGSGSDAHRLWLRAIIAAPGVPIVYLLVLRLVGREQRGRARERTPRRPAADTTSAPAQRRHEGDQIGDARARPTPAGANAG